MITHAAIRGGAPSSTLSMADHLLGRAFAAGAEEDRLWTREPELPEAHAPIRAEMHPDFATLMGVRPDRPIDRREVAALLAGRRADGHKINGKRYVGARTISRNGRETRLDPIGSYDLCFTVDKSVSVAWAFAPAPERAALLSAHHDAVAATMDAVEGRIGQARLGAGGRGGRLEGQLCWLTFDHVTSRPVLENGRLSAGDPDLHRHVSIMNVVYTTSGRVGTLDTIRLRGWWHEARCLYHAELAAGLQALGAQVERVGSFGAATLTAIPQHVRDAFSKRTLQGEKRAQETIERRGLAWDRLTLQEQARYRKFATQVRVRTGDAALDAALRRDGAVNVAAWGRDARHVGWMPTTVLEGPVRRPERAPPPLPVDRTHALLMQVERLRQGAAKALQRGGLRSARVAGAPLATRWQACREAQAVVPLAEAWMVLAARQDGLAERMTQAAHQVVETMARAVVERELGRSEIDR